MDESEMIRLLRSRNTLEVEALCELNMSRDNRRKQDRLRSRLMNGVLHRYTVKEVHEVPLRWTLPQNIVVGGYVMVEPITSDSYAGLIGILERSFGHHPKHIEPDDQLLVEFRDLTQDHPCWQGGLRPYTRRQLTIPALPRVRRSVVIEMDGSTLDLPVPLDSVVNGVKKGQTIRVCKDPLMVIDVAR